jgi:murein DD-endopeptidase MepM/ murein hydrolase activator NlpD
MKNHFYASLLIGISLIIASVPCLAKKPQASSKSASEPGSQKPAASKKSAQTATKKSSVAVANKQTKKSGSNAKDNKHDSLKSHQLAKSKDNKHDKSKSRQLADAKDSKNGKHQSKHLADKDNKHGKSKSHQLAYAKDKKHGRKRSHQVEEETVVDESEETATAETESDEQAPEVALPKTETDSVKNPESNSELVSAPPKTSRLFFQPLDKSTDETLSEGRTKTPGFTFSESKDNSKTASTPKNDEQPAVVAGNKERIHSSISRGNLNSFVDHSGDQELGNQVASTHGVVESSLDSAGAKAGLSEDMMVELTEIFAWDVDFANNLQAGDQFTVVYEQGTGKASNRIIAAQFINQGKTYTALRYKDQEGIVSYYTPEGKSTKKAFLTTPVDFAKVSSHFSTHRRHPILNRIRAHKGVDYAARTGTPVKAAGDGVITFHGNQGGYGRMIVISHGEHYETAYAHLSNFRKGLEDGAPVKQGEIIGYVGQSGLATGPHLHYEFRVDGVHRDPEKLDSKQGMHLADEEWRNFHAQTVPVLTRLNQAKATSVVAKNP